MEALGPVAPHAGDSRVPVGLTPALFRRPCVYLECTNTYTSTFDSGIQRAVRGIIDAAQASAGRWHCIPVVYEGRFLTAIEHLPSSRRAESAPAGRQRVVDRLRQSFHAVRARISRHVPAARAALHSRELEYGLRRSVHAAQNAVRRVASHLTRTKAMQVEFVAGDILVVLDASWAIDLTTEMQRARNAGARVFVVVMDLIPIQFPEFAPEGTPLLFERWLRRMAAEADGLLAISQSVSGDLQAFFERSGAQSVPPIDHFYLGANFPVDAEATVAATTVAAFGGSSHAYLVVGTIEPRKDATTILGAFERMWAEGRDTSLVFVGRGGWRSNDLLERLRRHPSAGKRIFWLERASDTDLAYAYRHASALIFASRCEGFGLPLVEAMHFGLPVIASDIAVFREIGGDYPIFFRAGDIGDLCAAVGRHEADTAAERRPREWLSWADSAQLMLQKVGAVG